MIQKKFTSMHFSVTRYLRLAIITSLYLSGFKRLSKPVVLSLSSASQQRLLWPDVAEKEFAREGV